MARGNSGRLIVDVDPHYKQAFHAALAADGLTYKEWVLERIETYLEERHQPSLPGLSRYTQPEPELQMAAEAPAQFQNKPKENRP